MTPNLLAQTPERNTERDYPTILIRECRECGGHPIQFASEDDLWAAVHAFAIEGWAALRDGNAVRVWWADVQEGTA